MNFGRDYLFGEDFVDGLDSPSSQLTAEEIKKAAHIVNGGEVALTECPSCRGSGRFRSYTGRLVGDCFKCKGKGGITTRQVGAIKAKATKEANQAAWKEEHSAALAYIQKRAGKGSTFYGSFLDKLQSYGTLTEGQMAVVYKDMAADAAFWEKKKAERAAAAPKIGMAAIEKMFAIASENKKNPKFYAGDMVIYPAKATSRNPGAIYVKVKGEYAGKIASGRFFATAAAPAGLVEKIDELAADPRAAAAKWGKEEVRCCFCGIELTDPVSRENGYGPICAENWMGG